MMHPISSPQAQALVASALGDRIRFAHAAGGVLEASEHGFEDSHTLWGSVDVAGDPDPLFRMTADSDLLYLSPLEQVTELDVALGATPGTGTYVRLLGDGSDITAAAHTDAALALSFQLGGPAIFQAVGQAISVTITDPLDLNETLTDRLDNHLS